TSRRAPQFFYLHRQIILEFWNRIATKGFTRRREKKRSDPLVNHTFDRNPEVLAASTTTTQGLARQSARPSHRERREVVDVSKAKTLADQIAEFEGALTARQLSELLSVSALTVFKMAKSARLPSFRIGASVRFCPATIARWLRERGG